MGPNDGSPPDDARAAPPLPPRPDARVGRGHPWLWLVAAVAFVVFAGAGGLAAAYLVAGWNAVPPPAALVTPAPPRATPSPSPATTALIGSPTRGATEVPSVAITTPAASVVVHVVAAGENLTLIARRYGVTVADIVAANGITDPNRIAVGQRLAIPVAARSPAGSPPPSPASAPPTPAA